MMQKPMSLIALCLLMAGCSGYSMDSMRGDTGSYAGGSGSSITSFESGYGISSGSSAATAGNHLDWGE